MLTDLFPGAQTSREPNPTASLGIGGVKQMAAGLPTSAGGFEQYGKFYTSKTVTDAGKVKTLVTAIQKAFIDGTAKETVWILSGTHGTATGGLVQEKKFSYADKAVETHKSLNVYGFSKDDGSIVKARCDNHTGNKGIGILAWCFSEQARTGVDEDVSGVYAVSVSCADPSSRGERRALCCSGVNDRQRGLAMALTWRLFVGEPGGARNRWSPEDVCGGVRVASMLRQGWRISTSPISNGMGWVSIVRIPWRSALRTWSFPECRTRFRLVPLPLLRAPQRTVP